MKPLPAFASVVLLLSAACSGRDGAPAADIVIGEEQLAAILRSITNASFGDDYLRMELSVDDSGPTTAEDLIEDADNPDDERADLTNYGFVQGYETYYFRSEAIFDREGPFVVGATVNLFETADGASDYLADDLADGKRDLSGTSETGSLQAFDTFDTDVGDQSWGAFVRILGDAEFYGTAADFDTSFSIVSLRRGRLVATAGVFRADGTDATAEALTVAKEIDERIQAVLRGEELTPSDAVARVDPEGEAILRQSYERLAELQNYRVVQDQTTVTGGSRFQVESNLRFSKPDLVYGTSNGIEIALIGVDAFVRVGREEWQCFEDVTGFSMQELGFNPPDMSAQLDIEGLATEVVVLSDKTVDGYNVKHIQATLDPERYVDRVKDLIGAQGPLGETLDDFEVSRVTIESYVDSEMLPRRINVDLRLRIDGVSTALSTETVLSDFDEPFEFPLTEPYPLCGVQES